MRCPECDAFLKSTLKKCPNCSFDLSKTSKEKPQGKKGKDKKRSSSKIVDKSGKEDEFIQGYEAKRRGEATGAEEKKSSVKPTIAAALMVLAAVDATINAIFNLMTISRKNLETVYREMGVAEDQIAESVDLVFNISITCYVIMIIIAVLLLVGAYLTFKRKKWPICLAIAIIGIFSVGFVLTSTILAVIALILIIISRREFMEFEKGEQLPNPPLR